MSTAPAVINADFSDNTDLANALAIVLLEDPRPDRNDIREVWEGLGVENANSLSNSWVEGFIHGATEIFEAVQDEL